MNTFTKTEVFLSVFVQKRSSVNGALGAGLNLDNTYLAAFSSGLNSDTRCLYNAFFPMAIPRAIAIVSIVKVSS